MSRHRISSTHGSSTGELHNNSSEEESEDETGGEKIVEDKETTKKEVKDYKWCCKRTLNVLWQTRDMTNTDGNRELYVTATIRELVTYIVFLAVLGVVSFGMNSTSTYNLTYNLRNLLLSTPVDPTNSPVTFSGIGSFDDYFNVLQGPLLQSIYVSSWYNKQDMIDQDKNFVLYENKLLGVPRLRQVRVKNDSCKVATSFKKDITECYGAYSSSTEDKTSFGPNNSTAWRYTPKTALQTASVTAVLVTIEGGGYYIDLTRSLDTSKAIVSDLFYNLWLRRGTRAVLLDLTLYNANVNLFCVIKLIVEFPATGGALTYSEFRTVKLLRYISLYDYFVLGCEGLYLLFILYYLMEEAIEIKYRKLRYFHSFWNILDILVILISIVCAAFNVYRTLSVSAKLDALLKDSTIFPDFDFLSYWQIQFNNAVAVTIFIAWIKFFKYISFNKTMTQLSTTLERCGKDLAGFAVMFFIVFLAFAMLGYLIFGYQVSDYQTFSSSIFSLFRLILGDFNFEAMQQANPILGPLFFIVYVFFVFFILLNMFIAIINDSYAEVKEILAQQKNDFEMGDFFKQKAAGVLQKLQLKQQKLTDIQKAMHSDLNGDQLLDFDEWTNALKAKGFEESEIEAVFARYDINGDRVLDQQEQAQLLEELEGMKSNLNVEIERENRMVMEDLGSDDEYGQQTSNKKRDVTSDEFQIVTERVNTMETIVAGIIGKIDAVLNRMEEIEKAKLARRQTSTKLLDALSNIEKLSDSERRLQLESILHDEIPQWKDDSFSRFSSSLSVRPPQFQSRRGEESFGSNVGSQYLKP